MTKRELEGIATTPDRKKIWALFDGITSTDEIASKTNITQRTVQIFVKELIESNLIVVEKRGYPKRRFDYVPSDWKVRLSVWRIRLITKRNFEETWSANIVSKNEQ